MQPTTGRRTVTCFVFAMISFSATTRANRLVRCVTQAKLHPARQPSINEVRTCTGDPNTEANWKPAGLFSGGKANLNGFAPGATIWVRVRIAGLKGVMGAWSDPAKIMVV